MFESDVFEPYPISGRETGYPLIRLDDEYYVRVKLFYSCLQQNGYSYTFTLPNRPPVVIDCEDHYRKGADLFEYNEWVFVRISRLDLKLRFCKDRVQLHE